MPHPITIAVLALYAREAARLAALRARSGDDLVLAGVKFQTADRLFWGAVKTITGMRP